MAGPLPVVLDCDTGVDDSMAIFYGLLSPDIDVVAIGSVWGNTTVDLTTANTLRLLDIAGAPPIPVARGAAGPLLGPLPPVGLIHGADGQGNTNLPPPARAATGETASAQLIRLAHERPGVLTLVPTGPLTNVALALAQDPEIAQLYRGVVLMGGAFGVPGNITPTAEANIAHDPEAAQRVFAADWPVVAVGLDVTHTVWLTEELRQRLDASGTPAGRHLHRITQFYMDGYARRLGQRRCGMHDVVTLAVAADPTLVLRQHRGRVAVELTGTHTRGMTIADLRPAVGGADTSPAAGAVVTIPLALDGPRFLDRFMALLCGTAA
ncbi:MAG TPA: nucleoside hydrolase [Thermomicrobiales bacterium]|nr:nucleoside hydrolase [Thermomicrobiales bacterium]